MKNSNKYLIGDVSLLDEKDKVALLNQANRNETYEDFTIDVGWASWMEDFTEADDEDIPSEAELDCIEQILRQAWDMRGNA